MPTSANNRLQNTRKYLRTSKLVKPVLVIILMVVPIVKVSLHPSAGNMIVAIFMTMATTVLITILHTQDESDQEPEGQK